MKKSIFIVVLCLSFTYCSAQYVQKKWLVGSSFSLNSNSYLADSEAGVEDPHRFQSLERSYSINPYFGKKIGDRTMFGLNYSFSSAINNQDIYYPNYFYESTHSKVKSIQHDINLFLRYKLFGKEKVSMDLTAQAGVMQRKISSDLILRDLNFSGSHYSYESSVTPWEDALVTGLFLGLNYDFNAKWRMRLVSELMTYNKELQIDFSQDKNIDFSGDSTFDWINQLSKVHFAVEFRF